MIFAPTDTPNPELAMIETLKNALLISATSILVALVIAAHA